MYNHFCRGTFVMVLILFGLIINQQIIKAIQSEDHPNVSKAPEKSHEDFNPGDVILEHVGDAYKWHIFAYKDFDVSIPLPVIIYSKYTGFHLFSGTKFGKENEKTYLDFQIATEGDSKGRILEKQPDGTLKRPFDISITKNVLSLFFSLGLMLWIFISVARRYEKNPDKAPKGLQSLLEPLIVFVRDDIGIPSLGKDRYEKFMPYLLTVFFFIFINNLLGLIPIFPGGANVTGNIAVTMVLALITFIVTMFSTNKHFWVHMVNTPGVPWWLKLPIPLMPFIEFSSSIIIRPFVLMIRLFANILAGHINVLSFIMLIFIFGAMKPIAGFGFSPFSIAFVVFIYFIELLVAFIQAYVFTLLSALYFGMAKESSHH